MKKFLIKFNIVMIYIIILFASISFVMASTPNPDVWERNNNETTIVFDENNTVDVDENTRRYYFRIIENGNDDGTYYISTGSTIYYYEQWNENDVNELTPWAYKDKDDPYSYDENHYVLKCTNIYYVDIPKENMGSITYKYKHEGIDVKHVGTEVKKEASEWYERVISFFFRLIGKLIQKLISLIAGEDLSIDKLVFDQYSRTNLFIFEKDAEKYGPNTLVDGSLDSLNEVFALFRNIALTAYLIILVYTAIQILLTSTTADKKARYKELFFDWVKGIAILYFFPYVIRYTILLNHAFVTYVYEVGFSSNLISQSASITATNEGIEGMQTDGDEVDVEQLSGGDSYMYLMYKEAEEYKYVIDALCWILMLLQVLKFLIVYIKRLITILFLIAIFPLVTISYAIDKVGDGKSQAFNNWCKEFVLQVFIQSFHAINYVLLMGIIFRLSNENWFLKILCISYIAKGGDILKGLFAQMKGGAGKASGPMEVAKSLAQTKLIMSGVRGVKDFASRTVGSNSLIGKGVAGIAGARNTAIRRREERAVIRANEYYNNADIYGDGTPKQPTVEMIKEKINILRDDSVPETDEEKEIKNQEKMEAAEFLNSLTPEQRKKAIESMFGQDIAGSEEFRKDLEDTLENMAAISIIQNTKGRTKVEIRTAVDTIIRFRNMPFDSEKGKMLKGFMEENKDFYSKDNKEMVENLRKLSAANSVEFAHRADNPHIVSPNPEDRSGQDEKSRVDEALTVINTAVTGEYTVNELDKYVEILDNAQNNDELREYIHNYEQHNMSFSIKDFKTRMEVEVINDSHRMDSNQERVDQAIRYLKDDDNVKGQGYVLKGLRTNRNELEEGVVPILKPVKDETKAVQKQVSEEMAELSEMDMLGRNSQEYVEYLKDRESELSKKFRKELVKGVGTTVAGAAVTPAKVVLGTSIAGISTGATSSSGKDGNMFINMATVVPNTIKGLDDVIEKGASLTGSVISSAGDVVKPVTDEIFKGRAKSESLDTINSSMEINQNYYKNQAVLNETNRRISEAEIKRQRLIEKINKSAGKK